MVHIIKPCKYTIQKRLKVVAHCYVAGDDCNGISSYYWGLLEDGTQHNFSTISKTKLRVKCKCGSTRYYD